MRNCMTRALYKRNDGARWKDKGEGEPFGHTLGAFLGWSSMWRAFQTEPGRMNHFISRRGEHVGHSDEDSFGAPVYESRIRRFVREERRGEGERGEQPACSPVPDVKLFRDSRPPEKSSMRRTRPWSESRMRRFSVAEITRRSDLRPSWALSMNE